MHLINICTNKYGFYIINVKLEILINNFAFSKKFI